MIADQIAARRDAADAGDPRILDLKLKPNNSLSAAALEWVMWFTMLVALVPGIFLYVWGAWPAIGLMGLDIYALYFFFRRYQRKAQAYERVILTRTRFCWEHRDEYGAVEKAQAGPAFLQLRWEEHPRNPGLTWASGNREIPLGRYLGRDEKYWLHNTLVAALKDARRL